MFLKIGEHFINKNHIISIEFSTDKSRKTLEVHMSNGEEYVFKLTENFNREDFDQQIKYLGSSELK